MVREKQRSAVSGEQEVNRQGAKNAKGGKWQASASSLRYGQVAYGEPGSWQLAVGSLKIFTAQDPEGQVRRIQDKLRRRIDEGPPTGRRIPVTA